MPHAERRFLDIWIPLTWLVLSFLVMLGLRYWTQMHLQGLVFLLTGHQGIALWVFFLIFFPGILVHEMSHWLMAKLLFVRTGRITLWPNINRDHAVYLGSVEVERTDPIRGSLIGLAPLLAGSAVVVLIGAHLQLESLGRTILSGEWVSIGQAAAQSLHMADFWLWVYLLFAIANRMLPSPVDRQPWKPVLIFLALLVGVVVATGWNPQIDAGTEGFIRQVVGFLIYAFSVTAAIDLAVALSITLLEALVSLVTQRRIVYRQGR